MKSDFLKQEILMLHRCMLFAEAAYEKREKLSDAETKIALNVITQTLMSLSREDVAAGILSFFYAHKNVPDAYRGMFDIVEQVFREAAKGEGKGAEIIPFPR